MKSDNFHSSLFEVLRWSFSEGLRDEQRGRQIRRGPVALLSYCVCQRVAALPKLVDFPLQAAVEDYCDSPRTLTFYLTQVSVSGLIKRKREISPLAEAAHLPSMLFLICC